MLVFYHDNMTLFLAGFTVHRTVELDLKSQKWVDKHIKDMVSRYMLGIDLLYETDCLVVCSFNLLVKIIFLQFYSVVQRFSSVHPLFFKVF